MGEEGPHAVHDAPEVDADHPFPRLDPTEPRIAAARHAGVVAHHVDVPEALDRRRRQCLDLVGFADVGREPRACRRPSAAIRCSAASSASSCDVGEHDRAAVTRRRPRRAPVRCRSPAPVTTATVSFPSSISNPSVLRRGRYRPRRRPQPARYRAGACTPSRTRCEIRIPDSHSLKDRRQVVRSLLAVTRERFHVSAAEVGGQDTWQRATLGLRGGRLRGADRRADRRRDRPLPLVAAGDRGARRHRRTGSTELERATSQRFSSHRLRVFVSRVDNVPTHVVSHGGARRVTESSK